MASQDDLGMLWYGVAGLPFNTADPSDVLLNAGAAPPLLSDHPRPLLAHHPHLTTQPQLHTLSTPPPSSHHAITTTSTGHSFLQPGITAPTYSDQTSMLQTHHTQMLYDTTTGDYITPPDYMYETLENYDDDSSGGQSMLPSAQHDPNIPSENASHQSGYQQSVYQEDEAESQPAPKTKKPKVHHHPALKLKTPIAYQKDTDLSAIPIMREGMAVCEKCGAIGVKHAFYGKERKFCSLACARPTLHPAITSASCKHDPLPPTSIAADTTQEESQDQGDSEEVSEQGSIAVGGRGESSNEASSLSYCSSCHPSGKDGVSSTTVSNCDSSAVEFDPSTTSPSIPPLPTEVPYDSHGSFDWTQKYLRRPDFRAVPVKCFPHAPMSECWDQMGVGMKVEVACGSEGVTKDAYWVATVMGITGYKACLRFEGFMENNSKDFWVDLCSEEVHPVGWCASQGKALIPPRSIQDKYSDWKQFLMRRLTGARTLPSNFHSKVIESHKSRFRPGLNVEVVDKNRIAQMRVATVTEVVGKRLHLRYHGAPPHDNGFWCHEDAPIIHPIGWSREVGHEIVASQSYHEKCLSGEFDPDDAPPPLFVQPPTPAFLLRNHHTNGTVLSSKFTETMKLEAIDPLNLSTICVATVMKVLRNNYLMIRIDSYESDNTGSDWFCYHATSPCIFPAGFCQINNITLTPPKGYEGEFSWYNYLKATNGTAAPPALFNRDLLSCGFEPSMSLEAADLMDPRLVCVATVKAVHGRLLQVHFDGWEDEFDQWIDALSSDIYPVGWCQMVGYKLEGPRLSGAAAAAAAVPSHRRKLKGRGSGAVGRKKRGGDGGGATGPAGVCSGHLTGVARRGRPPKHRDGGVELNKSDAATTDLPANASQSAAVLEGESDTVDQWGSSATRGCTAKTRGGRGRGRPRRTPSFLLNNTVADVPITYASTPVTSTAFTTEFLQNLTPAQLIMMTQLNDMKEEAESAAAAGERRRDGENSDDDTSSGVASLADSDNSSMEGWSGDVGDTRAIHQVHSTVDPSCERSREDTAEGAPLEVFAPQTPSLNTPTPSIMEQQQHNGIDSLGGVSDPTTQSLLTTVGAATYAGVDGAPEYILPSVVSLHQQQQDKAFSTVMSTTMPDDTSLQDLFGSDTFPSSTFDDSMSNLTSSLQQQPQHPSLSLSATHWTDATVLGGCSAPYTVLPATSVSGGDENTCGVASSTLLYQLAAPGTATFLSTGLIGSGTTTVMTADGTTAVLHNNGGIGTTDQPMLCAVTQQHQAVDSSSHIANTVSDGSAVFSTNTVVNASNTDSSLLLQQQQPLYIPRLLDAPIKDGSKVQPKQWSAMDVVTFLEKNDCAAYSTNFLQENIDGPALLSLHQRPSRVMSLTGMKVGPSLKIQDLVKQLVALVSPAQARYQQTLLKRGIGYSRT